MSKLPKFSSNKKYWMILNRLVFGYECQCPSCNRVLQERYVRKYLWCGHCRKKYRPSSYRSSWLYGMKLKPKQLFVLLWCWQQKKSPDTARLLAHVSYTTAARWYQRFREQVPAAPALLESLVQIDESYFGRQRSKQPQLIVVGAIEPDTRKVMLRITNSRSQDALEQFVTDYVAKGTMVVSDKWYAYQELPLLGYGHESWNHSTGEFAGTNQAEGIWSSMKRYLRKLYGSVPTKNLQLICNEWMARQNQQSWFASPENFLQVTLFHIS
jgi:ribosomal protein L37AE/L43A